MNNMQIWVRIAWVGSVCVLGDLASGDSSSHLLLEPCSSLIIMILMYNIIQWSFNSKSPAAGHVLSRIYNYKTW